MKGPRMRRLGLVALLATVTGLAVLAVLGLSTEAFARPGGGDSYSGGGGHGDSGGGDGGGALLELVFHLIRLCFYYPKIGLPLLALVVGFVVYSYYKKGQNKDWDSGPPAELERAIELEELRRLDPDFSQVVFEDFAFRLFSAAHRARASEAELAAVAPYVMMAAQRALLARLPGQPVSSVVIGAMRTFRVDLPDQAVDGQGRTERVRIGLEFEANVTAGPPGKARTYFSVESWLLGRAATAHSKPPGEGAAAKLFPCPNCGAPWQAKGTGTQVCASCGQSVDNGRFDWTVEQISLASIDERPPTLTADVRERGTDLPTYHQAGFDSRWRALMEDDGAITEEAVVARLKMIYGRLNEAWSHGELGGVRGLVSDGLYDYLQYWVDAYRRSGLQNQLRDMRITHSALSKLVRDPSYDALTVRIWGKGKDFVVKADGGELVRGSKTRDRSYSEYWTLIRSAARTGAVQTSASCGNCGAPLQVNMAGACEHCGAHLTRGEFDWVLSKIEQDDSYRG
jgi:uncharacterized Zn finger protein (UPF0148 family)